MAKLVEALDVKVGDLIASDDSRNLQVVGITSAKNKSKNVLTFDFDDGSSRRVTSKDKILLLCRPAV